MQSFQYEGFIKKRGEKLGFWHRRYCMINGTSLLLRKSQLRSNSEENFDLTADTRIDFVPDSKEHEIIVEFPSHQTLVLTDSNKNNLHHLLNELRLATLKSSQLSMGCFEILCVLGRGHFGKVSLCRRLNSDQLYAIKSVHKSRLMQSNKFTTILNEKSVLLKTRNPFIVNIHFAFQTEAKFYLGLEYIPGGDLSEYLTQVGSIPIVDLRIYLAEMIIALQELHSKGIIYRDLKPENILINKDGHIKLTDFGLSRFCNPSDTVTSFCGTMEYISPEMIKRENYGFAIDYWSLGIIAYELSVGRSPFKRANHMKTFHAIVEDEPQFTSRVDSQLNDLIKHLLIKDPKKRMTLEEAKKHPFFASIDFDKLMRKEISPNYIPQIQSVEVLQQISNECPADSFGEPVYTANLYHDFSYVSPNLL